MYVYYFKKWNKFATHNNRRTGSIRRDVKFGYVCDACFSGVRFITANIQWSGISFR